MEQSSVLDSDFLLLLSVMSLPSFLIAIESGALWKIFVFANGDVYKV